MTTFELNLHARSFEPSDSSKRTFSYLDSLNERQKEAVTITEGPLMVLAGAGSGKTKMMTSRIVYLMDHLKVSPHQILAVTFTNKAAHEMRERVKKILSQNFNSAPHSTAMPGMSEGTPVNLPEIGTFHSVCIRLLRREIHRTAFEKPFVIYDDADQLHLIKDVLKKLNIDEKQISPKSIQGSINRAKCDAQGPAEVSQTSDMGTSHFNFFQRRFQEIYELYEKELIKNCAIDFGGIICQAYALLRDHEDLRRKYQNRFRYLHVDEYQDTNRSQYLFLSLLSAPNQGGHRNICVVGDEDQSIYKWRGADIRNILEFERDYPGAQVVKLEQNYRSTKTIIEAASQLIDGNRSRKKKKLWTENESGGPIVWFQLSDEQSEAEVTVAELKILAEKEGYAFNDFAIFYRTNAQSRQFEDVLRREKIPYQIVGGLRFYDRKEIKDILSYFKTILNPNDSISLKRILNVPARGIGKTTVEKIDETQAVGSWWDALVRASLDSNLTSAATAKKLLRFVEMIDQLKSQQLSLKLSELYHLILDQTRYVEELKKEGTDEAQDRISNLEEFNTLLQEFEESNPNPAQEHLTQFIEQTSLASDLDQLNEITGSVKLMTLHSSKGLEFPVVFIAGMEEGLFPSIKTWEETPEEDIEEERRLCYVGMTRAEKKLYLMNALERRVWGNIYFHDPSRFISEIPSEYIEFKEFSRRRKEWGAFRQSDHRVGREMSHGIRRTSAESRPELDTRNPFEEAGETSIVGRIYKHTEYGRGKIVSVEGSGESEKAVIEFEDRSRRKFLLKYVRREDLV